MNKKIRNRIFWTSTLVILTVIVIITIKVIYQTQNPSLFEIDFDKKDHIISSYGTLIGVILTFLSIIFVLFTIIQQKEQFEEEKKLNKTKEKQALFDRLKLVNNLILEISLHISDTGKEMKKFYKSEIEKPLNSNQMSFYTNKNYYRLLELDYLSIFNSFQEFVDVTDKTKPFNNLYKKVDFYSESISEQKEKYQYHIKDKFIRKSKIANELNLLMDNTSKIIEEYHQEFAENEEYKTKEWYQILNGLIGFYYERIPKDDEVDFELIDKEVLLVFLQEANELRKTIGFEKNIQDIVLQISGIRKQLFAIKMESVNFGEQMKRRYNDYFSEESKSYKNLIELKLLITESIKNPVGNKV